MILPPGAITTVCGSGPGHFASSASSGRRTERSGSRSRAWRDDESQHFEDIPERVRTMKSVTPRPARTVLIALPVLAMVLAAMPAEVSSSLRAADEKAAGPGLTRSARSGPWSAPATWEGDKVPAAGARVQV